MDVPPALAPNPAFAALKAYATPRHGAPIDLWLNANEGRAPAPDAVLAALGGALAGLQRYPSAARLEAAIAARHGVQPNEVLVTAGADEAIDRAFRVFLGPERSLILPSPTFVMFPHYAALVGCNTHEIPWDGAAYPEADVLAAITPETGAIACVSPNNPTGAAIAPEVIARIAAHAPHAAVFVDLAYAEYAAVDPMASLLHLPNAVFFRTFSKAWGLAGARVGYAIARPEVIAWLRAAASPYSVATPSIVLALSALSAGEAALAAHVAGVREARAAIDAALTRHGARTIPSEGNFVFATFATAAFAAWFVDALAGLGIAVRGFAGHPRLGRSVRVTCPDNAADTRRVVHAIDAALAPRRRLVEDAEALEKSAGAPIWYFARTEAGVRAARATGAVPIGLGDPGSAAATALISAGAARVVTDPETFEESLL
jgi:histidinol-phosphate aminotransferase